jgi:polyisoprenoid-binding protein YceI
MTLAFQNMASLATAADTPQAWLLDLSNADVSFSIRVLGLFSINGAFEHVRGGLVLDESCAASGITFRIDSASVNTRDTGINDLLRGPTLLNAQQFPVISFSSTQIVLGDAGPGLITGELALNGITREVHFELERHGESLTTASDSVTRFMATTQISRSDFGITALPVAVSDSIHINVVIEAKPDNIRLADATL